jgi:major membrane immunogen (membrane-anchored lipoprotein)
VAADDDFEDPEDLLDTEEEEDDDEDEDDEDLDLEIDDDLVIDVVADDDDDDVDLEDDDDEADDTADDEAEESLDVLLAREQGEDDVLVRLDEEPRDGLVTTTTPIGADEFTCTSCFLVKRRAQLADAKQMICFDCA